MILLFPKVLEGLGTSSRLVGDISNYPGTFPTSRCRVMARKSPGECFRVHGVLYDIYIGSVGFMLASISK